MIADLKEIKVETDLSERPEVGASTADLQVHSDHIQFSGSLAAILNSDKSGYVGFCQMSWPIQIDSKLEKLEVHLSELSLGVVYSIFFKINLAKSNEMSGRPVVVTYSYSFEAEKETYSEVIEFSRMQAYQRGKLLPGAPELDNAWVEWAGLQVLRSRQDENAPKPLNFHLRLNRYSLNAYSNN